MLRKRLIVFHIIVVLCPIVLTACDTDIVGIENQNFATTIGVDYKNGEYYVYIQMLELGSVSKSESGEKAPVKVYVSETKGKTFIDGFFKAYRTAQERFLWAHVTAIVLSENVLQKGLGSVFDGLTRYYEFRPTPWIFGTKKSMKDILSTIGFFNQGPLNTILHSPESSFEQSSTIKPVKLNQFAREFFDPDCTTYIPSLTINDNQWEQNKKKDSKLEIDGAFFLSNYKYKGFFPYGKIKGIRWITPETERASILLPSGDKPEILTVLEDQKVKIQPEKSNRKIRFNVFYTAKGIVSNRLSNATINVKDMEDMVRKGIISEVRQLYQLGLKHDVDFLNLEHELYRHYNDDWKKQKEDEFFINEDSLKSIEVHIILEHSGSFNNRKIRIKES